MPLEYREIVGHRDVEFHPHPVPHPSRPHLVHVIHAGDARGGGPNGGHHIWVDPIEHARADVLCRVPHDLHDEQADEKAHDGIGQRESQHHTHRAHQYSQRREPVHPRVLTICHQRR